MGAGSNATSTIVWPPCRRAQHRQVPHTVDSTRRKGGSPPGVRSCVPATEIDNAMLAVALPLA